MVDTEQSIFMILEYIDGETLDDFVFESKDGRLPESVARSLFRKVSSRSSCPRDSFPFLLPWRVSVSIWADFFLSRVLASSLLVGRIPSPAALSLPRGRFSPAVLARPRLGSLPPARSADRAVCSCCWRSSTATSTRSSTAT